MSKQQTIYEMLQLSERLNQIVAELEAKKEIMLQDTYSQAA